MHQIIVLIVLLLVAVSIGAWILFRVGLILLQEAFDRLCHLSRE